MPYIYVYKVNTEEGDCIYELHTLTKLPKSNRIQYTWSRASCYPRLHSIPQLVEHNNDVLCVDGHEISGFIQGIFGNCSATIMINGKKSSVKIKMVSMKMDEFVSWTGETWE